MSVNNKKPAFIGVDWGTSSFRAWLFDRTGHVLDRVYGPFGITQVTDKAFRQTLMTAVGDWLSGPSDMPVVMCGMIGSAQGWVEATYLSGTVGVDDLAAGVVKVPDPEAEIYIIPGLQGVSADGHNDVMRGEETLLAGELRKAESGSSLFCLPGTHSKWIAGDAGRIERLTTFMTGELFQLIRANSILSPLIDEGAEVNLHSEAFAEGVALAKSPSGPLHQLFAIRAGILTGRFARADVLTLLSAVLVGSECKAVTAAFQTEELPPVRLISSGAIAETYKRAFSLLDISYQSADSEQAAQAGLFAIFQRLSAT